MFQNKCSRINGLGGVDVHSPPAHPRRRQCYIGWIPEEGMGHKGKNEWQYYISLWSINHVIGVRTGGTTSHPPCFSSRGAQPPLSGCLLWSFCNIESLLGTTCTPPLLNIFWCLCASLSKLPTTGHHGVQLLPLLVLFGWNDGDDEECSPLLPISFKLQFQKSGSSW